MTAADEATADAPPVPAAGLPLAARAPGKCILFGEHSVVYGRPEILVAVDLYTQVGLRPSPQSRLNGDPEAFRAHPYVRAAIERFWPGSAPLDITVVSRLPKAAGLGSSGALVAALATGLAALGGGSPRPALAEATFAVERGAQGGVGSPGDTSASVAGGYLAINAGDEGRLLWEVADERHRWMVRRLPDPGWTWVVAYSGVPRDTAATVRAVAERVALPGGTEQLDELERIARAGLRGLVAEDRAEVGARMNEAHARLAELGISHPRLEALREATEPAAEGAKLTGAGAGGSLLVLPKPGRETEAVRRLARAGGLAFAVRAASAGAALVETPAPGQPKRSVAPV